MDDSSVGSNGVSCRPIQNYCRSIFTKKNLKRRLPITSWLPNYNLDCFSGDMVAGFTVGLTVIPQGIAYAVVAGLAPNYGLYSAFMGCFIYLIFGSVKDVTIGPTAIMAIMTHEYSGHGGPEYAVLLCFLSGVLELVAGLVNLGFLVNFISKPVISGFTSAAAITIATSQLKGLFGVSLKRAEGFLNTIIEFIKNIATTRWEDITLGLICMIVLLFMRKMKDLRCIKPTETDSIGVRIGKKIAFFCSVGRNAVVVIIASVISFCLRNNQPFTITGEVEPGLPDFKPPPFNPTNADNETRTFNEFVSDVGSGVIIIPLIAIIENIAIASAFSHGKTIDASQEMIALGFCNLLGSFVSSMPVTGSFSRTAVNSTSGVKTSAGGVMTGLLVVLALAFLTSFFQYIPKASLAAVIICAVIFMVEYEAILPIWRIRRLDEIPFFVSFLSCLLWKLEYGILVGAGVNIALLLFGIARPETAISPVLKDEHTNIEYIIVSPKSGFFFPSVDYMQSKVSKAGIVNGYGNIPVVLDCQHFTGIDYSAAKGIKAMVNAFADRNQMLVFMNVSPGVRDSMKAMVKDVTIAENQNALPNILKSVDAAWGGISTVSAPVSRPRSSSMHDQEGSDPLLEPQRHPAVQIVPKE
ncbi:sodium-independent sulfate anion transporter-like isoform X2 [Oratosquilla oratoria]